MAGFQSLFWDLIHSLIHRTYYNECVLVWPKAGDVVVRHVSQEPKNTGEETAPREGECRVEGTPPTLPKEPAERDICQKAEEPKEAKV